MFWRSILGLSSQAVKRQRQYVRTETLVPTNQATWSHNPEDYNFESQYSAFSMQCLTTVFIINQPNTCTVQ